MLKKILALGLAISLYGCNNQSNLNSVNQELLLASNGQEVESQFFGKIEDYQKVYTEFFHKRYPVAVIAHRGVSDIAPENTMAAVKKSYQSGVDMIELDVSLTKDKVIVVLHDDDVDRTTNGHGEIGDLTLSEVKKLDAGSWFSPVFKGEQIPTLEEVLKYAQNRISINIEIKGHSVEKESQAGIERQIVDLLEKYDMVEHCLISSFNKEALKRVKQMNQKVPTAVLLVTDGPFKSQASIASKARADAVNEFSRFIFKNEITKSHKYNLKVNAFTVNEPYQMASLIKKKIDGLITDRPDLAFKVLEEQFPKVDKWEFKADGI